MKNLLKTYFSKRYLPRWIIYLFDLSIVTATFLFAFFLRFNLDPAQTGLYLKLSQFLMVILVFATIFYIIKPYSGIIRHSTLKDASSIFLAQSLGFLFLSFLNIICNKIWAGSFLIIPLSVICIHFVLSTFILTGSRIIIKNIYNQLSHKKTGQINIMIYGAGELGQITRDTLEQSNNLKFNLIGFIDDNKKLINKRNSGTPIYSQKQAFDSIIPKNNITEIIFAIDKKRIKMDCKCAIIDKCLRHKLVVKEIPSVKNWINGELSVRQIRKIRIEDLLGRNSIKLDIGKIQNELKNATILVTGAAGSIGSEIIRQLISFQTKHIILLDQAESPLFKIQQEMKMYYSESNFDIVIASITNAYRMQQVFEKFRPDIVFNAAAYKHVPLMESNPYEAIRSNLGGTKILADLAVKYNVGKFVMISTDKAVNPTNIMGASKRLSEIYIQSLAQQLAIKTKFITTRFGNVLGSNGSVVPIFVDQIKKGGPVTVTHKEVTRYFMTIPEACQLVLEASTMSKGGEIFVFDMGQPIRIYDLAKKMISLSGLELKKDIEIKITGLRAGEKLYEELLASKEETKPTYHEKIMIGKTKEYNHILVNTSISDLLWALEKETDEQLVIRMKNIIPEFISQNSKFCKIVQDPIESLISKTDLIPIIDEA